MNDMFFIALSGPNCEDIVYDCSSHVCQSGGSCVPIGPTGYKCICKPNYFGEYCQNHTGIYVYYQHTL